MLEDKRFAQLFNDPNFQINTESEEFRLLNPVVQKVNEKKLKKKITVAEVTLRRVLAERICVKLNEGFCSECKERRQ